MKESSVPIKLIARDLYRLQREAERLEGKIAEAPPEKREEIEDELRKCRAERERIRRILEGSKQEPTTRRPR